MLQSGPNGLKVKKFKVYPILLGANGANVSEIKLSPFENGSTYQAGPGIIINNDIISASVDGVSIIINSQGQLEAIGGGTGSGGTGPTGDQGPLGMVKPFLPVPAIRLGQRQGINTIDMTTNAFGPQIFLDGAPYLIAMDIPDEAFSAYDNIYVEMVIYRRKKNRILTSNSAKGGYVIPTAWYPGDEYPQPTWGNYWNRSGSPFNSIVGSSLGVYRANHFQVTTHNQYVNLSDMISNRWQEHYVYYRNNAGVNTSFLTFIPVANKRTAGLNEPTTRYSYSPLYTPMYVAFRYVAWDSGAGPINPNTGKPYGEIVSGPLSRVIKIIHKNEPFLIDYYASSTIGLPCAYINPNHNPKVLQCMFETHLP